MGHDAKGNVSFFCSMSTPHEYGAHLVLQSDMVVAIQKTRSPCRSYFEQVLLWPPLAAAHHEPEELVKASPSPFLSGKSRIHNKHTTTAQSIERQKLLIVSKIAQCLQGCQAGDATTETHVLLLQEAPAISVERNISQTRRNKTA